jgi:hypothetical protein
MKMFHRTFHRTHMNVPADSRAYVIGHAMVNIVLSNSDKSYIKEHGFNKWANSKIHAYSALMEGYNSFFKRPSSYEYNKMWYLVHDGRFGADMVEGGCIAIKDYIYTFVKCNLVNVSVFGSLSDIRMLINPVFQVMES